MHKHVWAHRQNVNIKAHNKNYPDSPKPLLTPDNCPEDHYELHPFNELPCFLLFKDHDVFKVSSFYCMKYFIYNFLIHVPFYYFYFLQSQKEFRLQRLVDAHQRTIVLTMTIQVMAKDLDQVKISSRTASNREKMPRPTSTAHELKRIVVRTLRRSAKSTETEP